MFRMNGYVQDERYIAREHMDVRRDCVSFARLVFVGWVTLYPRGFPVESQRCVTSNAPYGVKWCVKNCAPNDGGA